jgi:hypothetical protein
MVSTLTHALRGDFDAWSWGVSVAIWVAGVLLGRRNCLVEFGCAKPPESSSNSCVVTGSWPAVLLLSPCLIPLLLQPDKVLQYQISMFQNTTMFQATCPCRHFPSAPTVRDKHHTFKVTCQFLRAFYFVDILPASIAGPLEFLTSPTVAVIILTFLVAHLIKKLLLSKSYLKYDVKPIDQELKIVGKGKCLLEVAWYLLAF